MRGSLAFVVLWALSALATVIPAAEPQTQNPAAPAGGGTSESRLGGTEAGAAQPAAEKTAAENAAAGDAASESSAPRVPAAVGQLMQDRSYAEAVAVIDKTLDATAYDLDYLAFLKGRGLHLLGRYDDAVAAYDALGSRWPASRWARHARFAKGLALARKGDFRAAELAYRAEAQYLFSLDRKQEIAGLYLEYADALFQPPKEDQQPDYAAALDFYQRALKVGPRPETRMRIELRSAQCLQELSEWDKAIEAYRQFLIDHQDHTLAVEARFRLGETLLRADQPLETREVWRDLLELHRGSESDRLPQAAFRIAETYGLPEPADDEDLMLGVASLRSFLEQYPAHELAAPAHLRIAESFHNSGRPADAADAVERFLAEPRHRDSEQVPDARRLLGYVLRSQGKFDQALAAWQKFLASHPAHPAWSEVQQSIVDTEFTKAENAHRKNDYPTARRLWSEFLAKYPLDERCRGILYRLGQMHFAEQHWDAAIDQWRSLVSKYPQTDEASQAQFMIAATLEDKLGRLDEALTEYRKTTWGPYQGDAPRRIARLTAPWMSIATERAFRSDETPALTLVTRNLESVTVQVYSVDLEAYFRKMHATGGIESLDTALIDPERTFEFQVPDYQPYARRESIVQVPLSAAGPPPAGVMAVTVSSKTLEATTLVVQSDLDVIVKSSRDEVFVFAENMRTSQPWPGARVLLSDGQQVYAEGRTDDQGVFQQALKQLGSSEDVRVFVMADQHSASNVVALSGLGVAQGLSDKGYLYSDRPAYRPGQAVHLRGVIRKVAGDAYAVAEGKSYRLDIYDGRSRLIHDAEVTLNAFGSFHSHLVLPVAAVQGEYRVLVHDQDRESYQGGFVVQDYQLEPVQLQVVAPRSVYYRGETIEGTISASYYYGAPLADREIRYRLADGRTISGKTDIQGQLGFSLETRSFRESQPLALTVELPELNLKVAKTFYLSTQGFSLSAETARNVYLAGEPFELKVKASDAEGQPVQQELSVEVLRQIELPGDRGELLVESHPLQTAADGEARATLNIADGGHYTLRISGLDRFQNTVETETVLQISDDQDETRLRILADRHTFRAGDTAEVRVHWREQPALALATFQGATILDYRLIRLQTGENKLQIPITARLAPNFDLAVAVMTDTRQKAAIAQLQPDEALDRAASGQYRRFHETSSPFAVERELNVRLQYRRKAAGGDQPDAPLRPGEAIEVTVDASDPQGKPVAAELSLALVEQALLQRFASPLPPIDKFFRGSHRQSAVRTASSIVFAYRPETRPINPRLLAEDERLAIRDEETRRLAASEISGAADPDSPAVTALADLNAMNAAIDVPNGDAPFADDDSIAAGGMGGAGGGFGYFGGGGFGGGGAAAAPAVESSDPFGIAPGYTKRTVPDFAQERLGQVVDQLQDGEALVQQGRQLGVLGSNGVWFQIATAGKAPAEVRQQIEAAAGADARLLAGLPAHETGYWNPAVVTGADGKAAVTIHLPEHSTAWSLLVKGVTQETLAGEAEQSLAVSDPLFGQIKLASAFTDGDAAQVLVSVHNDVLDEGQIEVALRVTLGDRTTIQRKKLAAVKGILETAFAEKIELPPQARQRGEPVIDAEFELTVSAPGFQHVVQRSVPVRPHGLPVFSTAGGTAAGDAAASIAPPPGMELESPRLQVLIGPSIEGSLLDVVLAPAVWCQAMAESVAAGAGTAASDLMASLALQQLLNASREAGGPHAEALDARVRASIALLVALQNEDGGWGWAAAGVASDAYHSARSLWALSLARRAGYRVADESYTPAASFVKTKLAETAVADFETKALLLHALTASGQSDFTLANALYRNRPGISPTGLAWLALTFAEMDRKQTAAELLTLLDSQQPPDDAAGPLGPRGALAVSSWGGSAAEFHAVCALALQAAAADDGRLRAQIDWLTGHRAGHRWSPDTATGPAMLAVCSWYARSRFEGDKYKLNVYVNNLLAAELDVDSRGPTRTIDVPPEMLSADKPTQEVRFELVGRGRFSYQCVLGGFVPSDRLKSTTVDWRVERYHLPAPLEVDGQSIPRGFNVAITSPSDQFRNELVQLPVGRRGLVELHVRRNALPADAAPSELPYLVVSESLPAGVAVVENSPRGGFERYELRPGGITFYVGTRPDIGAISYQVHGYLPGEFGTPPTVVRDAFRPEQMAVAGAKSLTVLPAGEPSGDDYRLSPRELYELGRRHFDKGQLAAAGKLLDELFHKWNLRPEFYKDTVRMLLDVHLDQGPPGSVVKYFEITIEKFPDVEIPFAKLLQVGDAYHEIGEYERSYLVFRTMIEANFLRESRVAGFLESQGEFQRSVQVMSRLLRQYPPEPYAATASYSLAQRVYAKAPQAAGDQRLREQGVTRVDLIREALARLDAFLTAHPDDPAADQAAFSLANALLDLDLYERAIAHCERFATRYADSQYLDSYWYIIGYCRYALGAHEQALQMCAKVAESQRKDAATGRMVDSPNKWQAIYILGQIYHSLGQAEAAIREYARVKDRFADALQAIEYFTRQAISLPEVTTLRPQEAAVVELGFRNLAAIDVTVYRIDLMKFGLLRRDLSDITNINLSGIRPHHQATLALGDGKDYRDRTHRLELPLKQEGAYLVVCRGANLHASGLVLLSPLELEIQEETASGRVRVTLRDAAAGHYAANVHVKVIGSRNDDFVSGQSDLRGIFVADGIRGRSMVIAQASGGRYAFHRGESELGPPPLPAAEPADDAAAAPAAAGQDALLENLKDVNTDIQMQQQKQLQDVYESPMEEGVGGGFGGGFF